MSLVAYSTLLDAYAVAAGFNPSATAGTTDWDELKKYAAVVHINQAIKWAWRTPNARIAWPWTITTATVTVTSGAIAWSALGGSPSDAFFALFSADPRPYLSGASTSPYPLRARADADGVYPQTDSLTSVFAFYRTAAPQATYANGGTYTTPTYPDDLTDVIIHRANALRLKASGNYKDAAMEQQLADEEIDRLMVPLLQKDGGVPWLQFGTNMPWLNEATVFGN